MTVYDFRFWYVCDMPTSPDSPLMGEKPKGTAGGQNVLFDPVSDLGSNQRLLFW
jgi:hypothetical protein